MLSDITLALLYTFWEHEMCKAGQRVLLTIIFPGYLFLSATEYFPSRTIIQAG